MGWRCFVFKAPFSGKLFFKPRSWSGDRCQWWRARAHHVHWRVTSWCSLHGCWCIVPLTACGQTEIENNNLLSWDISAIEMEKIRTDDLPWSGRYLVRQECFCLLLGLVYVWLVTLFYDVINVFVYSMPKYITLNSVLALFSTLMSSVYISQDVSLHTGGNYDSLTRGVWLSRQYLVPECW